MSHPISQLATRVTYLSRQLPRMAWYAGHLYVMRRLAEEVRRREAKDAQSKPQPKPRSHRGMQQRLDADIVALFADDLANVEAGIYPMPSDHDGSLFTVLNRSRLFFRDLPSIEERRKRSGTHEVLTAKTRGRRPDYYLQNFHFQSGGWLTEESAERYDTQVEVLFRGTANAMRRQAIPPLAEAFSGCDQRKLRLVDLGCGTGRFLDFVKQTWPRLPVIGVDLSEAYIRHARRHLKRRARTHFVVANAEAIPVPDESCDAVTSIFTLHELPPEVRRSVIREAARVLKPGGRLILVDSLQLGDEPAYDPTLARFPQAYHEPYFESYVSEDFRTIAHRCGLTHQRDTRAFVSKVMVFDKKAKN
jgi:ubiquinone/menaquinone biosynthesis C-methylase UbiE